VIKEVESLFSFKKSILQANLGPLDNKEVESLRETVEQMRETIEQMRRGLDKHGLIGDDAESEDMSKSHIRDVALPCIQLLR
jgi:hypothetical protein